MWKGATFRIESTATLAIPAAAGAYAGIALGGSSYHFSKSDEPVPGDVVGIPEIIVFPAHTTFGAGNIAYKLPRRPA